MACRADAMRVHLSKKLTPDGIVCLNELIAASHEADTPLKAQQQLKTAAKVGGALVGNGREDFFYIFEDIGWCGSGGCLLMIGERQKDGSCRLLYEGAGDNITILRRRDYGYHRIYAPCELRFDGRQYQQVRPDCPTLDTQH
jgi:hypothetical protein